MSAFKISPRSGPSWLARVPADPAYAIAPGELLSLHGGLCRPASATAVGPDPGDDTDAREAFCSAFLGVAHSASPAGDGGPVSVDLSPSAVYAADCEPGAVAFGDPLGPAADGPALSSARLTAGVNRGAAVGRAVEARAAGDFRPVRVSFSSAFCTAANHVAGLLG